MGIDKEWCEIVENPREKQRGGGCPEVIVVGPESKGPTKWCGRREQPAM